MTFSSGVRETTIGKVWCTNPRRRRRSPLRASSSRALTATVSPDAIETWYDGIDQDCDGNDDDQDGDGARVADDCDDADPDIHPQALDPCRDGVDSDCDGNDSCGGVSGEVGAESWSSTLPPRTSTPPRSEVSYPSDFARFDPTEVYRSRETWFPGSTLAVTGIARETPGTTVTLPSSISPARPFHRLPPTGSPPDRETIRNRPTSPDFEPLTTPSGEMVTSSPGWRVMGPLRVNRSL